ncbi:hypothetical protein ElyMa_003183200 [Elysia marginata]|uniref:Reverse transcriptase domain-containing protein n=1 Tax=Elysia marginata TaxID=1093978 RepID=A0AAV4J044_9GAST|nr:hypothetical protein ElyMa_003183200 [Elysia marginata]
MAGCRKQSSQIDKKAKEEGVDPDVREYIFRESNHLNSLNINGTNINNIRYVDDITLLATVKRTFSKSLVYR